MNGRAFVLQVAYILRVGRDLDRDELVFPDMVPGTPDFTEGAGANALVQDVFRDSLIR
jgi:hypothetical protein